MNTAHQEASACEKECQSQQAALTACMNAIRDAREVDRKTDDNEDKNDIGNVDTSCLAPTVAAWTSCCSKANNGAVEINQGHIGIADR